VPWAAADARGVELFADAPSTMCGHDVAVILLDRSLTVAAPRAVRRTAPLATEDLTAVGWGFTDLSNVNGGRDLPTKRLRRPGVRMLAPGGLVISRALVELLSRKPIAEALAFRGGTALYKLHMKPAARYSEDIDLVQTSAGGIGEVLDAIHGALDPWLGKPKWKQTEGRVTLDYRFESEDVPTLFNAVTSVSSGGNTTCATTNDGSTVKSAAPPSLDAISARRRAASRGPSPRDGEDRRAGPSTAHMHLAIVRARRGGPRARHACLQIGAPSWRGVPSGLR
jgi:hypothetical protein